MTKNQGFSLIEVIVAVTLITIITVSVTGVLLSTILGAAKAEATNRVRQNAEAALVAIERSVRNGIAIDTVSTCVPTPTCGGPFVFESISPAGPVRIYLDGATDRLMIEDTSGTRPITGPDVEVTNFTVHEYSVPANARHRVRFSVSLSTNAADGPGRSYQQTFSTAVMMRNKR